jgi:hypothetical protein
VAYFRDPRVRASEVKRQKALQCLDQYVIRLNCKSRLVIYRLVDNLQLRDDVRVEDLLQLEGRLPTFELHWMVSKDLRLLVSSGDVFEAEPQRVES